MSDPTRFTFDGVEYGVVEKDLEPLDIVVIRIHGSEYLRRVTEVSDGFFTVDTTIDLKHVFDLFAGNYFVVEPLEETDQKQYQFTDFIHPDSAELSSLIEDEADDFKNFLLDKNDRYGDSVLHTYRKYGQVSFDVRIEDKKNRLRYLLENDGDIEDTIKDLHGYMILNDACRKLENQ